MNVKSVFISHSSKDKAIAEMVVHSLEGQGVSCWIAPRDILPGSNYGSEITKAIRECSVLLLLYSENSNKSDAVYREVQKAFEEKKILVPLRLHDIPPSDNLAFFMSGIQWIDASPIQPDFGELAKLISSVSGKSETNKTGYNPLPNAPISIDPSIQKSTGAPPKRLKSHKLAFGGISFASYANSGYSCKQQSVSRVFLSSCGIPLFSRDNPKGQRKYGDYKHWHTGYNNN